MVEDAGARADGGDAEAPALRPAEAPRLKHTRSSRRRLERVLTESGVNAEDRVDEYLEWFEAEPPAEIQQLKSYWSVWKLKFYGAFVPNHRVVLHAIDATPARWRGDAGSSPLGRARTAASSPRNDLVKNCRCTRRTG